MENKHKDALVWIDLETTGLNPDTDYIIEIACIVTDKNLNILDQSLEIVIHQSDEILDAMGEWCKNQHGKTGLTEAVTKSVISVSEAERIMIDLIAKHTVPGWALLAGSSVHFDKSFLRKSMPHFTKLLNYRILDVSSVKELCRRWYPQTYLTLPGKLGDHRALCDIQDSIKELKWYRNAIFKDDIN